MDSQSPREVAGCRPCRTAPAQVSPPSPRTSSTSTRARGLLRPCTRTRASPPSGCRSAPPGTAARAWAPRSTRTTSWPSARPSASTGRRRAPRAAVHRARHPRAVRPGLGHRAARCSPPTTSRARRFRRRLHADPAVSHAILAPTAAHQQARGRHRASPRRTTRPRTAASSTTRPTAARPTPTPPRWIADRANEMLAGGARRGEAGRRPLGPPAPRRTTTSSPATSTTWRTCSTSTRSARRRAHRRRPAGRGVGRLLGAPSPSGYGST